MAKRQSILSKSSKKLARDLVLLFVFYLFLIEPIWNGLLGYFQAEAVRSLHAITNAQRGYYQANAVWTDEFGEVLIGMDDTARYSYFLSPDKYEGRPLIDMGLSIPVNFEALGVPAPGLTDDGFIVVAIGNIDLDGKLDVWWTDQSSTLRHPVNDIWGLWIRYGVRA